MTHSQVRLWDNNFAYLAGEVLPDNEIGIADVWIRIEHKWHGDDGPLAAALREALDQHLRNLYITIDADPQNPTFTSRRGGIVNKIEITEQACPCGHCDAKTNTLTIDVIPHQTHLAQHIPETVTPPRGYGIGLLGGGNEKDTIIGCWATENEARAALADMRIVALGGAPVTWWDQ